MWCRRDKFSHVWKACRIAERQCIEMTSISLEIVLSVLNKEGTEIEIEKNGKRREGR